MNFRVFVTQVCAFVSLNLKVKSKDVLVNTSISMIEGSNYEFQGTGNDNFNVPFSLNGLSSEMRPSNPKPNYLMTSKMKELAIKNAADINDEEKVISLYSSLKTKSMGLNDYVLKTAVKNKNINLVKFSLEIAKGSNSNYDTKFAINNGMDIALGEAVRFGHSEIVELLLESGVGNYKLNRNLVRLANLKGFDDIEKLIRSKDRYSFVTDDEALAFASELGYLEIVMLLVNGGADVNAFDGFPLNLACNNDQFSVIEFLVDKGADLNANNGSLLVIATEKGKLPLVEFLVSLGADVNAGDGEILAAACGKGDSNLVSFLIDEGAAINANGGMALQYASKNGHLHVVQYLDEKGAIGGHYWAKKLAELYGHAQIVEFFESYDYFKIK